MNDLLPTAPEGAIEFHAEEYRGVTFTARRMSKDKPIQLSLHGGHQNYLKDQLFERFQTNTEIAAMGDKCISMPGYVAMVKVGINRLVENCVVYTGDLRRRYEVN